MCTIAQISYFVMPPVCNNDLRQQVHSTKFLIGHFLNSLFLTKRLNHWNEFLPKYVQLNGQNFKGLSEKFSYKSQFFGKNAKICFLDKNGFE